jgi:hypothetical protein
MTMGEGAVSGSLFFAKKQMLVASATEPSRFHLKQEESAPNAWISQILPAVASVIRNNVLSVHARRSAVSNGSKGGSDKCFSTRSSDHLGKKLKDFGLLMLKLFNKLER